MEQIDTKALCRRIISRCEKLPKKLRDHLDVEHLMTALGGLANIYMEALNKEKNLSIETHKTFASIHAPVEEILIEIQHCIGVNQEASDVIFEEMQLVFKEEMSTHSPDEWISFAPLGKFKVKDLNNTSYHFKYQDPAFKVSDKFLIRYRDG